MKPILTLSAISQKKFIKGFGKYLFFLNDGRRKVKYGYLYLSLPCREQLCPVLKHTNMKSRITIEVDFNNGNTPVIQIIQSNSDDVRDKLIKSFTECLNGSSWCQIRWVAGGNPLLEKDGHFTSSTIFITPIPSGQLKDQADIMLEQYRLNQEFKSK